MSAILPSARRRRPTHPGAVLRDVAFPALPFSKSEIADQLGISRQTLYDILNEKQPITPQMAVRIGKLLGNGPVVWHNMQAAYDLWEAVASADVSNIPTYKPDLRKLKRGG